MNSERSTPKTSPYKGVRDFYPEDYLLLDYIFTVMRDTARSFGYHEYTSSILEPTNLYTSKTSSEIVNEQTYSFTDRGDREVTLRPEMTPSVARLIAGRHKELPWPQKWFSIPNVFRYERPQRGRLREHWQLNVDVFGVDSIEADQEVILLAATILKNFGLTEKQFTIKLNDRQSLDSWLEELGLSTETKDNARRLLDMKNKLEPGEFGKRWHETTGSHLESFYEEPESIKKVRAFLATLGFPNTEFSPEVVRGFDYYTGIVFEIFDNHPENNRSLFGGGRYNNLLDIFELPRVPAFGFGMGDVTMLDVLKTYELLPTDNLTTGLYIIHENNKLAHEIAQVVRESGLAANVDMKGDKYQNQERRAYKSLLSHQLVIEGPLESLTYKIKNLRTGAEDNLESVDAIIELIK